MKCLQDNQDNKNRPIIFLRPVLILFSVLLIITLLLRENPNPVKANSLTPTSSLTPEPHSITVPESGEPVILSPGNDARLVSPLKLKVASKPGDDGMVRIELIGRDNRLIFRKLLDFKEYKGNTLLIEQEIPFEIRSDEKARLQVVLENAKGKPVFITSVNLTLLSVGGTEVKGEEAVYPRFKIEQPYPGQSVQGEFLVVKGQIKPVNNTPIVLELIASDWHTLTSKIVAITLPADQTAFIPIEVKLSYKTGTQIPATLRIRQESNNMINGTVMLWSEMITLVK